MAKKKISPPLYNITTGEPLDPAKDLQAPIPADSDLAHQEATPVPDGPASVEDRTQADKQDPLNYIMENYGEALKNRDVPGLLCGLIKEIVLLRMAK